MVFVFNLFLLCSRVSRRGTLPDGGIEKLRNRPFALLNAGDPELNLKGRRIIGTAGREKCHCMAPSGLVPLETKLRSYH